MQLPQILVLHILMVSELMEGEQGHLYFLLSVRWKLANVFPMIAVCHRNWRGGKLCAK